MYIWLTEHGRTFEEGHGAIIAAVMEGRRPRYGCS